MPRRSPDHFSPIEVAFGDVIKVAASQSQAVIVELGENFFQGARISQNDQGDEVLSGVGTLYREDVTRIGDRWDMSRIYPAFLRGKSYLHASEEDKQGLLSLLQKESVKPPIILNHQL